MNLFKVLQGTIKTDATLVNGRTVTEERLHQISTMRGKEQTPGERGGRGRHRRGRQAPRHHAPATSSAPAAPTSRSSRSSPRAGARRWRSRRGPRATRTSSPTRCTASRTRIPRSASSATPRRTRPSLWGMGETHVGIALEKLERKFGAQVDTEDVLVAYRETITGTAEAEGRYKKQTGGHGQFGVAFAARRAARARRRLRVRRRDRRRRRSRASSSPRSRRACVETMGQGGVYGFPVVDVRVTVLRRQAPPRRLVGDELQDGGQPRVQGGDGQGVTDRARADQRARRHRARGLPGRHHGRPQLEARPDPGVGLGRRRRVRDPGLRADVGDPALRDRPALDHRRARPVLGAPTRTTTRCPRTSPTSWPRPGASETSAAPPHEEPHGKSPTLGSTPERSRLRSSFAESVLRPIRRVCIAQALLPSRRILATTTRHAKRCSRGFDRVTPNPRTDADPICPPIAKRGTRCTGSLAAGARTVTHGSRRRSCFRGDYWSWRVKPTPCFADAVATIPGSPRAARHQASGDAEDARFGRTGSIAAIAVAGVRRGRWIKRSRRTSERVGALGRSQRRRDGPAGHGVADRHRPRASRRRSRCWRRCRRRRPSGYPAQ